MSESRCIIRTTLIKHEIPLKVKEIICLKLDLHFWLPVKLVGIHPGIFL